MKMKKIVMVVSLMAGMGMTLSSFAVAPAVDVYYFQYTPQPGVKDIFGYDVALGAGFNDQSAKSPFAVGPGVGAGMGQVAAGAQGSFSYKINAILVNKVAATCTATIQNGTLTVQGSGMIPCSAVTPNVTVTGTQVWTINFNNSYPASLNLNANPDLKKLLK